MNEFQDFTESLPFVISFLVLLLLIAIFTNAKIVFSFLVLVFVSMVITNAPKVTNMLNKSVI